MYEEVSGVLEFKGETFLFGTSSGHVPLTTKKGSLTMVLMAPTLAT
jgi:hypothetical protein